MTDKTGPIPGRRRGRVIFFAATPVLALHLFFCPAAPLRAAEENLRAGMLLLAGGEFELAVAELEQATRETPGDSYAHHYLGRAFYGSRQYEEALVSFLESARLNPGSGANLLGIGKTCYRLQRDDQALEALAEAEALLPDDPAPPFYRGLVHYRRGEYDRSAEMFARAAGRVGPEKDEALRLEIDSLIRSGRREAAERRRREALSPAAPAVDAAPGPVPEEGWRLHVIAGLEWDGNVVLLPDSPPAGIEISGKSSPRLVVGICPSYHRLAGPLALRAWYRFYRSWHRDFSGYDLLGNSAGISGSLPEKRFRPGVGLEYARFSVGGEGYLESFSLTPFADIVSRRDRLIRTFALLEKKDYLSAVSGSPDDRDGTAYSLGADSLLTVFRTSRLRTDGRYTVSRARGDNWEFSGPAVGCSLETPVTEKTRLSISGRYQRLGFRNRHSLFGIRRDDRRWTFSIGATRQIAEQVSVSLHHVYTRNSSNIPAYKYRRNISSLMLQMRF